MKFLNICEVEPNIYHAVFSNPRDLALTMMRLQEFYESPYDDIRNQHVTLEAFLVKYMDEFGYFSYPHTWHGFNVPGEVVDEWYRLYHSKDDVLDCEQAMIDEIIKLRADKLSPWYLIATDSEKHDKAFKHELAHARYHLRPKYRSAADLLLTELHHSDHENIVKELSNWGYHKTVIADEMQAYLSTSRKRELEGFFGEFHKESYDIIKLFRKLFKKSKKHKRNI